MSWWQNDTAVGDSANLDKLLSVIKWAEGGAPNRIVGGGTFSDFSQHPRIVGLRTKEGPSTAAGDYQITATTYDDVAPKIGVKGFNEADQRAIAIELIRRNGAMDDALAGDFEAAIQKLGKTWASLPSSPYSQPKKSWGEINKMLGVQMASANSAQNWWANDTPVSDAGTGGQWWAGDTPVDSPAVTVGQPSAAQPAPAGGPAPAAEKPAAKSPAKKEEPRGALRRVDDFVRGLADTLTFGYADEIAGKLDSLVGGGQSGLKSYEAAVAAQRQRDKEGGGERIAGQVAGAFVPGTAAIGAVRAVPTAGRLARAGAGAATGAIQGGLYGSGSAEEGNRLEGAAEGALTGAALGGVLGGVLPATVSQKADDAIRGAKKKGTLEELRIQSEIAQDFKKVAQNPNLRDLDAQGLPTVATALRNQQNDSYVDNVVAAIKRVEPNLLKRFDVETALKQEKVISPEDLQRMRSLSPNGQILADSIEKYQIARTLTAPTPASGSLGAKTVRFAITNAPRAAAAAAGASSMGPIGLALGAITPGAKGFAERVTGKMTVPERIEKLAQNADVFAEILKREGGSKVTVKANALFDAARRAEQSSASQRAVESLSQLQETTAARKALGLIGAPRGGAYNAVLENTGLTNEQAIPLLRKLSKDLKGTEIGTAATRLRRSLDVPNEGAFFDVQNILRDLKGNPGVLSQATTKVSGKGSEVSRIISKLPDDQVMALAGRTADTMDKPIGNLKGYLTTRASRALETYKKAPDKLPTEDIDLLKALGVIQ